MLYSVWNQGRRCFDYYEAPGVEGKANVEKPTHLRGRTLGSTPTQAAWPLPTGAKLVGSGAHARGRIGVGATELGGDMVWLKVGLLCFSAYLVWKYVR